MVAMPRYGTPNIDYMVSWLGLAEDGPMWALNLMKYRPVAQYADGRVSTISGAEADEIYKPDEPLAQCRRPHPVHRGGDRPARSVTARCGTGWPWRSTRQRAAMMTMQMDPQFEELHAHKDAGMEFTIVNATFPREDFVLPDGAGSGEDPDRLVLLEVVADASAPELARTIDSVAIGRFGVEDVIVGDERRWAEARWDLIDRATADELTAGGTTRADDRYVVVLDPRLDLMAQSLRDHAAGTFPAPAP